MVYIECFKGFARGLYRTQQNKGQFDRGVVLDIWNIEKTYQRLTYNILRIQVDLIEFYIEHMKGFVRGIMLTLKMEKANEILIESVMLNI